MEKVRRQHYVPRMYLKRFGYGNIGDEYISVLKLDNGRLLYTSVLHCRMTVINRVFYIQEGEMRTNGRAEKCTAKEHTRT